MLKRASVCGEVSNLARLRRALASHLTLAQGRHGRRNLVLMEKRSAKRGGRQRSDDGRGASISNGNAQQRTSNACSEAVVREMTFYHGRKQRRADGGLVVAFIYKMSVGSRREQQHRDGAKGS